MSKYHSITRSCELRNARVSWKPKGVMGSWKQRDDMGVGLLITNYFCPKI